MAEYTGNDHEFETTGVSPFFANYGCFPHFQPNTGPPTNLSDARARGMKTTIQDIQNTLKDKLARSQEIYCERADRKHLPAPRFFLSDKILIDTRNVRTQGPSKRLDNKWLGLFKVVKAIGKYEYRILLPPTIIIHLVFHVFMLEQVAEDPREGQVIRSPPSIEVDEEEEYEVDEILNSRIYQRRIKYLVKWRVYEQLE